MCVKEKRFFDITVLDQFSELDNVDIKRYYFNNIQFKLTSSFERVGSVTIYVHT
jgi:hypothetical protein